MIRWGKKLFFTLCGVAALVVVGTLVMLSQREHYCTVSARIVFCEKDPRAVFIGGNGKYLYVFQQAVVYGPPGVWVYDANGKRLSYSQYSGRNECTGMLVCYPDSTSVYLDLGSSNPPYQKFVRAEVATDGRVTWNEMPESCILRGQLYDVLSSQDSVYAVGADVELRPTIVKFGSDGLMRWLKEEAFYGHYSCLSHDRSGNVITAGELYENDGTLLAKYSAAGDRMWLRRAFAPDGSYPVWMGVRKNDDILLIVCLHSVIGRDPETRTPKTSGRYQDFVLLTYSPAGKILGRQVLSHGRGLYIIDAALDNEAALYVLGDRERGGTAQVIKYDSLGRLVWSGAVRLPYGCLADGIIPGAEGSIYITGRDWWQIPLRDYQDPTGSGLRPPTRAFIYKLTGCQ